MLHREKCDEILKHLIEPDDGAGFFVCGPGPLMDAAEEALLERGVDKHKIHIERFTAARPSAAVEAQMHALQDQARGLTMQVTLDGRQRPVPFDAEAGPIPDSARAAGLTAPYEIGRPNV